MKTTKVLQTNISEINILEVSDILNTSTKNRVAICNANTLVRSVRNVGIRNSINNFTIKAPDGFPVAKALSFLTKQKFSRVDGYKVFLQTIENGLSRGTKHYFFGNNDEITQLMINKLTEKFPNMKIAGYLCPEFMSADDLVRKYKEELKSSMFNYLNLQKEKQSKENEKKIVKDFHAEKLTIDLKPYYFSNIIAKCSKTMIECNNSKLNLKSTGTEG